MDDGRDEEFIDFVTAQRTALLRFARLLSAGDDVLAEDLVQTALTRLYVSWRRVRRAGNPVGYARATLTHVFVDETRRAHRHRETVTDRPQDRPDRAPRADERDLKAAVEDALARLAPRQRAVVVLRHWLDLDVAETARLLGCTAGTVKSQTAKALAHLRDDLREDLSDLRDDPGEARADGPTEEFRCPS